MEQIIGVGKVEAIISVKIEAEMQSENVLASKC